MLRAYRVDRSQRQCEVEVITVVNVSVLHELQIFISHHLQIQNISFSVNFLRKQQNENRSNTMNNIIIVTV